MIHSRVTARTGPHRPGAGVANPSPAAIEKEEVRTGERYQKTGGGREEDKYLARFVYPLWGTQRSESACALTGFNARF